MSAIDKLLNPAPTINGSDSEFEPSRNTNRHYTDQHLESPSRKKTKLCKDAAIFVRGPIQGQCRYPPQESQDTLIATKHQEFQIYPAGKIAEYPRHIPYSSEKKTFLQKTGRDSLEVFQYQFKVPGDEATYSMLWDYNIGLVRTTPLFKCTGHSKTTPAKMLNRNPGLREICHSITGGALVAQGYWMPFEAAKAVAATFCWQIRYALTPVFGSDFLDLCLPPEHPKHGDMTIDPAITIRCTAEASLYRDANIQEGSHCSTATATPSPITSETAAIPLFSRLTTTFAEASDALYSSDTSIGDGDSVKSSGPFHRNMRTPVHIPRSVPFHITPQTLSRNKSEIQETPKSDIVSAASSMHSSLENDEAYDGDSSSPEHDSDKPRESYYTVEELEVAHIIANMKNCGRYYVENE